MPQAPGLSRKAHRTQLGISRRRQRRLSRNGTLEAHGEQFLVTATATDEQVRQDVHRAGPPEVFNKYITASTASGYSGPGYETDDVDPRITAIQRPTFRLPRA